MTSVAGNMKRECPENLIIQGKDDFFEAVTVVIFFHSLTYQFVTPISLSANFNLNNNKKRRFRRNSGEMCVDGKNNGKQKRL